MVSLPNGRSAFLCPWCGDGVTAFDEERKVEMDPQRAVAGFVVGSPFDVDPHNRIDLSTC